MNNPFSTFSPMFTGKGGTMRLGLCFAFLYSIMEFGYGLNINNQDGASFGQNLPFSPNKQEGQDKRLPNSSTESTSAE